MKNNVHSKQPDNQGYALDDEGAWMYHKICIQQTC